MIHLAWRWLMFQKGSALAQWFAQRTAGLQRNLRNTMIVAPARKLLIALWRYVAAARCRTAILRPVHERSDDTVKEHTTHKGPGIHPPTAEAMPDDPRRR
ncbi:MULTISPECIES: hypothetical protein [Mesorhizobium]|uniref:Transposase n=1 Tax=Mesorhizobium muleiense TaxID=1004279 RepID=A0A1G9L1Q2_9HYPH|nr:MULTISPECIES: hypothetical protein [Mesorhizobium]MCF6102110.1 hypothetical protein [Mesorhizobium muleiense]SDL55869.1 hypothetical protein SAMN05428953_14512 [Mesorhizobium muleiense]